MSAGLRGKPDLESATQADAVRGSWAARASLAATVVLLVTLIMGLTGQGSFYSDAQPRFGVGITLALLLALLSRPPARASASAPVLACLSLAVWAITDGMIHGGAAAGLPAAALALAVAAVLVTVQSLASADRGLVIDSLPLIGGLLAATAWFGLLTRSSQWATSTGQDLWRAGGALGYPNAAAAVLVPLALFTIARSAAPVGSFRWAGPGLATCMLTATAATLSRGGIIALLVGFVTLVALGGGGVRRAAPGPLAGAALATLALLPSMPTTARADAPLAAVGLFAGVLLAWRVSRRLMPGDRDGTVEPSVETRVATSRRAEISRVAIVGAVALLLLVVGLVAASGPIGRAASTVIGLRAGSGSAHRIEAARVALRELAADPLIGAGPDNSQVTWHDARGASVTLHYLHDEYLQVLRELGIVGALLLVGLLVAAARAVRRGRPPPDRSGAPDRAIWVGSTAACCAFAAHSGLDFLWHLPALPVLAIVLLALAANPSAVALSAGTDSPNPTGAPLPTRSDT